VCQGCSASIEDPCDGPRDWRTLRGASRPVDRSGSCTLGEQRPDSNRRRPQPAAIRTHSGASWCQPPCHKASDHPHPAHRKPLYHLHSSNRARVHSGLKIPRASALAGSTPAPGTGGEPALLRRAAPPGDAPIRDVFGQSIAAELMDVIPVLVDARDHRGSLRTPNGAREHIVPRRLGRLGPENTPPSVFRNGTVHRRRPRNRSA